MNPMEIMQKFEKFKADMTAKNPNMNPQEIVNQMVQSGKASQQVFEQARGMAAMLGFRI